MDYFFTPFDATKVEKTLIESLSQAKKSINFALYGFTDPTICDVLCQLAGKGIAIKGVFDKTEAATPTQAPLVAKLKKAGVNFLVGKSPVHNQLLHSKYFVIDDHIVIWGSLNPGPSGLQQFNVICSLDDPFIAKLFNNSLDKIYDHLKQHTLKPKWHNRILDVFRGWLCLKE